MGDISVIILPLFCLMTTASADLKVLGPARRVTAVVGDDVLLPCYLVPHTSAENMTVTWTLNSTGALVHLYKDGRDMSDQQDAAYRGRTALFKEHLRTGNASLQLHNVQISDNGDYACSVQIGNWSKQVSAQLTVKAKVHVLGPAYPITAMAGKDLHLPCHLSPNISALDMTVTWLLRRTGALVHLYRDGCDKGGLNAYRGRTALLKEELARGNASLKLTSVQVSDEAEYVCSIEDEHWRSNISVQVIVKVRPNVLGPARRVTAVVGDDVLLPCYLVPHTSADNMTVTWTLNSTGALVHLYKDGRDMSDQQDAAYRGRTALFKEHLRTGNASLQLHNVQISDNGDYICLIQDGPWRKQLSLQIKVNGRSTDTAHSWKAGFSFMFMLALALAGTLALLLYRVRRRLKGTPFFIAIIWLLLHHFKSHIHYSDIFICFSPVNVTLDPATAHPQLILSADGKQVVSGESPQSVSPSNHRFSTELCVLAREGFTHGKHYFEVLVQGNRDWIVGLISEHIDRRGPLKACASDLYLALKLRDGACYSSESSGAIVQLSEDIKIVGVFVDYDEGFVSFYDVKDSYIGHLYSFTGYCFTETLFPIFSPGPGDGERSAPLVILPIWDVEFKPLLTYEVKSDKIRVANFLTAK
ncbi:hypothetical protein ACEWY4_025217 [Coilia grayii]|uniref:Uncharacterized protein n=1 Tax=Coilia grayii TaxID=363190 RepID=A0ABD1J0Q9_9TELE